MNEQNKKALITGIGAVAIFACGFGGGFFTKSVTSSSQPSNVVSKFDRESSFGKDFDMEMPEGFTFDEKEDGMSGATSQNGDASNEMSPKNKGKMDFQSVWNTLSDDQKDVLKKITGMSEEELLALQDGFKDVLGTLNEEDQAALQEAMGESMNMFGSRPSRRPGMEMEQKENQPSAPAQSGGQDFTINS